MLDHTGGVVARNVERVGHIDIAGGGQVSVQGDLAFIGHMDPPNGTSILDVSDRSNPKVLSRLEMPPHTHSHKVRVAGDVMAINNESYRRHQIAAGKKLPEVEAMLRERLGRAPSDAETAAEMNYRPEDIATLRNAASESFEDGGLRLYNIADPANPKELSFFPTGGNGVHRFDFDGRYAYLSTGIEGYMRNIVVIVDTSDPKNPKEVGRWWMPGQWIDGSEEPDWGELRVECHHPMRFGDRLYTSYHGGGMVILDISDITKPRMVSHYNYHPPFISSTHTFVRMPYRIDGMDIAVVVDEQPGRWRPTQVPAFGWVFDVTDETAPRPLSTFSMSEQETPYQVTDAPGKSRFGAHQCHERMRDSLVYTAWFRGGLRITDIRNPRRPEEVGYFIPTPAAGEPSVQSNDVFVADDGLIYLIDRFNGLDILKYTGPAGLKGDS
ncbi:MAG: RNA polymerase subunit sigma-70 [Alphaproteobacteria bacterium]|nr:RNA polymerase subunit sigma-70 [Alphaproteobacteria bacterium]